MSEAIGLVRWSRRGLTPHTCVSQSPDLTKWKARNLGEAVQEAVAVSVDDVVPEGGFVVDEEVHRGALLARVGEKGEGKRQCLTLPCLAMQWWAMQWLTMQWLTMQSMTMQSCELNSS